MKMQAIPTRTRDLMQKMIPILLALTALAAMIATSDAASTDMEIDYSHSVIGTGTVMTDFVMGSEESTVATGRVRGSGEVLNRYAFSSNDSENVSIEDEFIFTKAAVADEITLADYPSMNMSPDSFRLLGTAWAGKINLSLKN